MRRVVLCRTLGPRNAGGVLRAVANFGPAELVFVAPDRPSLLVHPEFEQMSHGVENVAERVRVVADLGEALADCTLSVGFTARGRGQRPRRDWREARDDWVGPCDAEDQRVALVFGSEENGLTGAETDLCGELCYLPTSADHTSINLTLAVGIVLSSLYTGQGTHVDEGGFRLVDGRARAYLVEHLKSVFVERVARSDAARDDIRCAVERLFGRAPIETRDARAWHMMMRALGSQRTPQELGVEPMPRDVRRDRARDKARRSGRLDDGG